VFPEEEMLLFYGRFLHTAGKMGRGEVKDETPF